MLHPGRPASGGGPDFQGVLLDFAGERRRGDVELHREERDWWRHGHHRDPRFNGVVLHVVAAGEGRVPLANGGSAPTLPLGDDLAQGCPRADAPPGPVAGVLEYLGEAWFAERIGRFRSAPGPPPNNVAAQPGQSLYEGVAEALGYTGNKGPFLDLARRLPRAVLEALRSHPRRLLLIQARLLGSAGLLLSQRCKQGVPRGWERDLEAAWDAAGRRGRKALGPWQWRFAGVRPANYPTRRLAALGHLLASGRLRVESVEPRDLERGFLVVDHGYWRDHWDLGLPARRPSPVLLGWGRARVLAVNVLLPWAAAQGDPAAWESYRRYPRLEQNAVTRSCPFPALLTSARRQQGWLHLDKVWCQEGACDACPLGCA